MFACAYAMMIYLETARQGWLYVSAALAGFGMGIKYTAAVWILFVGVMYLVESLIIRRRAFLPVVKQGLVFTAIMVAIASPWFIKNQIWFHNPVYPFLTGELADYREGRLRYFDENDARKLNAYFDDAVREIPDLVKGIESTLAAAAASRVERHPFRFWEYFTKSTTYDDSVEGSQEPNYLFWLVPVAFFFSRRGWLVWLGLLSTGSCHRATV
jgi:hypothetical protein